ncbi:MAG TPA: hypothetical protein VHB73_01140, partial [Alphaproteobacteria bacterium]|nr:hypothetical protein [Alphaproteobacteria bacterium]
GFDVIIAIDDDNFLHDENFIGLHHAGLKKAGYGRRYASGWFNCCSMLAETEDKKFYPRGYPLSERRHNPGFYWDQGLKPVGVNAGLWLGEPDIDAVTRLAIFPEAIGFAKQDSTILAPGTWCPFNSQNTALRRELLPAWFMSPHVGRFDDIWASYIVQACMAAMGHVLHFGHPLVHQDRNAHDLFHDFDLERLGMGLTDGFCAALRGMTIDGKSYAECTLQALTVIDAWSGGLKEEAHRAALDKFTFGYRLWIEALETK